MDSTHRRAGFTLIELLLVVAIIGVISSVAIPNFFAFQLRAKSSEAKVNLSAISVSQTSYFTANGVFLAAPPEPAVIPGSSAVSFNTSSPGFDTLGWTPEGNVYFSYGVGITADGTGFTADAAADIDADGFIQTWAYVHPNAAGLRAPGQVGCASAFPPSLDIAACDSQSGRSIF